MNLGSESTIGGVAGNAASNDSFTNIENVIGTNGDDTFIGAADEDNTFTGGNGADTFTFEAANVGQDTVTDFSSTDGDTISFFDVSDFADLDISQQGDDTLIDFGSGGTLLLEDTIAADLTEDDFVFSGSADGASAASVVSSVPQPVSDERESFGFETVFPDAQSSVVPSVDVSINLGIGLDEYGQIFFNDDYIF